MQQIKNTLKRLFFAFKVNMPWPIALPTARLINEEARHMTVAFLGQTDFSRLQPLLSTIPLPSFKVGQTAATDQVIFLPEKHPHVVAWHVAETAQKNTSNLANYSQLLINWLKQNGFFPDTRHPFLPHITLGRAPFRTNAWVKAFERLPLVVTSLHLFESLGQLQYKSMWSHNLEEPFIEIEHTADIAFQIRGESVHHLFQNALTALAFKYPALLKFKEKTIIDATQISDIDDVIMALNQVISRTDAMLGCPFKAISFHGDIEKDPKGILHWEMIVDV